MNGPMIVYGVFIKERCIYVGCTSNLELRAKTHHQRFSKIFDIAPEIRVLKRVSLRSSAETERNLIRLYKDMGQAEFNSEPSIADRHIKLPTRGHTAEQASKILELVGAGHPRKEIGQLLSVNATEISKVCRASGIFAVPGRKKGTGYGYGIKINRAQHEEILRHDERNVSHAEIGRLFGITRERVRQICESAGRPTRRQRQRARIAERIERIRSERQRARILKRITPSPKTLAIARLWDAGQTIRQIATVMGVKQNSMAVWIIRLRQRHPELISYRRPEHLRFRGLNLRQLKKAA